MGNVQTLHTKTRGKLASFWSSVGLKIGALTRFFSTIFFCFANREIRDTLCGEHISHIQSTMAKRGLTERANVHTIRENYYDLIVTFV